MEKAREKLGERYFVENRQYGWVGDRGFHYDILDNWKTVLCVAACREDEASNERKMELDCEKLEKAFATWLDEPTRRA